MQTLNQRGQEPWPGYNRGEAGACAAPCTSRAIAHKLCCTCCAHMHALTCCAHMHMLTCMCSHAVLRCTATNNNSPSTRGCSWSGPAPPAPSAGGTSRQRSCRLRTGRQGAGRRDSDTNPIPPATPPCTTAWLSSVGGGAGGGSQLGKSGSACMHLPAGLESGKLLRSTPMGPPERLPRQGGM